MTSPRPTDYAAFMRALIKRAGEERRPVNAAFELTERCNLGKRSCS